MIKMQQFRKPVTDIREQPYANNRISSNGQHYEKRDSHLGSYFSLGVAAGLAYLGFRYNPLWFIPSVLLGLFAVDELVEKDGSYAGRQAYQI